MPYKTYEERLKSTTAYYQANRELVLKKLADKRAEAKLNKPQSAVVRTKVVRTEAEAEERLVKRRLWANKNYAKNREQILQVQKDAYHRTKGAYIVDKESFLKAKNELPPVKNELPQVENELSPA